MEPNKMKKMIKCPCCGNYYEIEDWGDDRYIGEICPICFWRYDIVGQEKENIAIGPNKVSLNEAKKNYREFGASTKRLKQFARKPTEKELPENN